MSATTHPRRARMHSSPCVRRFAPHSAEPHRLLAIAYERSAAAGPASQSDVRKAAEEIIKASDLRPADAVIATDLARMLRTAGRTKDADEALEIHRLAATALGQTLQSGAIKRIDVTSEAAMVRRSIGVALQDVRDVHRAVRTGSDRRGRHRGRRPGPPASPAGWCPPSA